MISKNRLDYAESFEHSIEGPPAMVPIINRNGNVNRRSNAPMAALPRGGDVQAGPEVKQMNGVYVKLGAALKDRLAARAIGQRCTRGELVRRYLEFAMLAEDNPHLPTQFINGILQSLEDLMDKPAELDSNGSSVSNIGWQTGDSNPVPR